MPSQNALYNKRLVPECAQDQQNTLTQYYHNSRHESTSIGHKIGKRVSENQAPPQSYASSIIIHVSEENNRVQQNKCKLTETEK